MEDHAITILLAEDNPGDQELTRIAFQESKILNNLIIVSNGAELLDCLDKKPPFENSIYPDLILMDLNMPMLSGIDALKILNERKNQIPVIVLTTSQSEIDIMNSYHLGVKSYIRKPLELESFFKAIKIFTEYWVEIVTLPPRE